MSALKNTYIIVLLIFPFHDNNHSLGISMELMLYSGIVHSGFCPFLSLLKLSLILSQNSVLTAESTF